MRTRKGETRGPGKARHEDNEEKTELGRKFGPKLTGHRGGGHGPRGTTRKGERENQVRSARRKNVTNYLL